MEIQNTYLTIDNQEPHHFMQHRIHKILLVCCTYDGYILEEDGHIESQINREYMELNLRPMHWRCFQIGAISILCSRCTMLASLMCLILHER